MCVSHRLNGRGSMNAGVAPRCDAPLRRDPRAALAGGGAGAGCAPRGDDALREYTLRYDGAELAELEVSDAEFTAAGAAIEPHQAEAIARAIDTVTRFHAAQTGAAISVETAPGVVCERIEVPIQSVGLYVPAGTAPLPSTAIMLAVPARLAGCPDAIICTPPRSDGTRRSGRARRGARLRRHRRYTRSVVRRRLRRSRTARRPCRASTRSSGRAMPGSPRPSSVVAPTPQARRSTCRLVRPKCW